MTSSNDVTQDPTGLSRTQKPTSASSKSTQQSSTSSSVSTIQSTTKSSTKKPQSAPSVSGSDDVSASALSSTSTASSLTSLPSTKTPVPLTATAATKTSKATVSASSTNNMAEATTTESSTQVPKETSSVATTKPSVTLSKITPEEPTKVLPATVKDSTASSLDTVSEATGKESSDENAKMSVTASTTVVFDTTQKLGADPPASNSSDNTTLKIGDSTGAEKTEDSVDSSKAGTQSRVETAAEQNASDYESASNATQGNVTTAVTTSDSSMKTKSEDGWTSGENSVSPTASSSKRTLRSTDAASSGTPTPEAMEADSETDTTPSLPSETSTTEPPIDLSPTLPDAQNASSTDNTTSPTSTTTSSPADPVASTSVSPEDFFGSAWTADPLPFPEGEPFPEPGYGGQGHPMGGENEEEEEEPASEPGPDWDNAKLVWKEAWEFHLYIFGCLFGLLGLYVLVCVLRLWRIHRLLSRRYFVSLNLLMLLLCATRAVYLMLDGYNSRRTFHPSLDYFLYSISFPCLTSAFSIQLYALLQATKMQFLPPTIQKMSLLMTIVVVHFAISIVTDVVVGMYAGMEIMLFVCQLFFILWGLFLFFGYAYIFRRLYVHAVKRQKNVVQTNGSVYNASGGLAKPKARFTLSVAVTVTMLTAVLGLVTVALEVYAVVGVYKTFSNDRPEPWPWYFYHTALRLVEFLMCATMGYVASQPFRYRRGEQSCCCPVLCAPCAEICCCGNDANRSETQAGWSELDQHQRASLDRGQPVGVGYHSNGSGLRGSKSSQKGGGEVGKARIYFNDHDDVTPIVTSQPGSRPTSTASEGIEGENATLSTRGSLSESYQGSAGWNSPGRAPPHSPASKVCFSPSYTYSASSQAVSPSPTLPPTPLPSSSSSSPTRAWIGVVNSAYIPTSDEPRMPSSPKSRKSSIASSEFFLGPSVSLADSMASELDKAFRSMHQDLEASPQHASSLPSLHSPAETKRAKDAVKTKTESTLERRTHRQKGRKGSGGASTDSTLDRHAHRQKGREGGGGASTDSTLDRHAHTQKGGEEVGSLRRCRSATGRCSFVDIEPLQSEEKKEEEERECKPWEGAEPRSQGAGPGTKGAESGSKGAEPSTKGAVLGSQGTELETKGAGSDSSGAWHQKLFRSRSDNSGGIRTKDVDNGGAYMSLLDIEKQQQQQEEPPVVISSVQQGTTVQTSAPPHLTVTCVDGGARSRGNSHRSEDLEEKRVPDCAEKAGDQLKDNSASSPSSASDVTDSDAVMTSRQPPYCTVIPVRSVRDRSDSFRSTGSGSGSRSDHLPQGSTTPASANSSSAPPPPSTPRGYNGSNPPATSSPATPRGFGGMNSSKGLLGYGMDDSDDIEV